MKRRVLLVQPDRLTCYRLERGNVVREQQWLTGSDRLPEGLRPYLIQTQQTEFNLLIDLPEEECHLESFKSTSRRDRKHLIAKMQNKRFENALLSKADVAGYGSHIQLLLSGVVRHRICSDLIRLLAKAGVSVRAVHSPLTLTSALARLSRSGSGATLFVIPLSGSYRLIACVNSFVFFSRRISDVADTRTDQSVRNDALSVCLTETLVYLQRQQVEGWDTPELIVSDMSTVTGGSEELFKPLLEARLVSGIRDYQPDTARRPALDLKREKRKNNPDHSELNLSINPYSTEAMLTSAACRCGNGYATRAHRSAYTTRKVRNICAALALCGVGGAVSSAAVARKITAQHEGLVAGYKQSAISLQNTIAGNEPGYEYSVEAVRQAMVTARLIELGSVHMPIEFLTDLAQNVHEASGVSVSSVQWNMDDTLNDTSLTEMLARSAEKKALNVEHVYRATVSGVVQGNPDAALTAFESFVATLRSASSDPSVVVVETPYGLSSQDRVTTSSLSATSGEFMLELTTTRVAQ